MGFSVLFSLCIIISLPAFLACPRPVEFPSLIRRFYDFPPLSNASGDFIMIGGITVRFIS